jgi:hypothetical protein
MIFLILGICAINFGALALGDLLGLLMQRGGEAE